MRTAVVTVTEESDDYFVTHCRPLKTGMVISLLVTRPLKQSKDYSAICYWALKKVAIISLLKSGNKNAKRKRSTHTGTVD
jgi:hypothetical protein